MEQHPVDDGTPPSLEIPPPPDPPPATASVTDEARPGGAPSVVDNSSTVVTAGRRSRRKPNIAAAIFSGLLAVAVFAVILLILNARGRTGSTQNLTSPPNSGAGGPAGALPSSGAVRSAQIASSSAQPARPFPVAPPVSAPGSGAGSDVVIYWRFGERDYFALHPKTSKKAILDSLIGDDSASIVRVDVENHGASTVTVDSKDFVLSNGTAMISPQAKLLPGALTLTHIPSHGSAQGWLLFIKPWTDSGGITDYLSESALPGAHISVSNRAPSTPASKAVKSPGAKTAPTPDETVVTTSAASKSAATPSPPPGASMPLGGK